MSLHDNSQNQNNSLFSGAENNSNIFIPRNGSRFSAVSRVSNASGQRGLFIQNNKYISSYFAGNAI